MELRYKNRIYEINGTSENHLLHCCKQSFTVCCCHVFKRLAFVHVRLCENQSDFMKMEE